MAERVDLEDRNVTHEAINDELAALSAMNAARMEEFAQRFQQQIVGAESLYFKTLLEHLVGAWELPRARLRFQRDLSEAIEASFAAAAHDVLSGADLAMSPGDIVSHLPNREQRRKGGR